MYEHPQRDGPPDPLEERVLRSFLEAQCAAILRRHQMEDFLLLRTLADHHQHAAFEAKLGRLRLAGAQLASLKRFCPAERELGLVHALTEQPALALVAMLSGDLPGARGHMCAALEGAERLATEFDHRYLSARRTYLAMNLARVDAGLGKIALPERFAALHATAQGDRDRWPHGGASSLSVPLTGDEALMMAHLLGPQLVPAVGRKAAS